MSNADLAVVAQEARSRRGIATESGQLWPAAILLTVMFSACVLAGAAPLGFSIATVFLFAGPHNWFEARYMLSRMPARWGPLRMYFLTGIGGAVSLTILFALLPWLGGQRQWSETAWTTAIAVWNSVLVVWIVSLALLRSRQNPRRDWTWLVPAGLVALALNWLWPLAWSLVLVYVHPLMALWFLDRELKRQRAAWHAAYRVCLAIVPLCLLALAWRLYDAPNLPGSDVLSQQITQHAGAGVFRGVSTHLLVATHTFLEMLHYGVWIVAIPLVSVKALPWQVSSVPLARRSPLWRRTVLGIVAAGAVVMIVLWSAFLADYPLTRNVYFTVAMLHVLAEVPFLLRLL
jgi:hypothetical protein